ACGNSKSTSDESVTLKLGHVVSEEGHYNYFAEKFKEEVNKESDGAIDVEIYPEGQLGGEGTMFKSIQDGSLDIEVFGQSAITGFIAELSVFDLPYVFNSLDEANEILQGDIGDEYLKIYSEYDAKGLAYLSAMERNIFSNTPIENISDIKGLTLRASETPSY